MRVCVLVMLAHACSAFLPGHACSARSHHVVSNVLRTYLNVQAATRGNTPPTCQIFAIGVCHGLPLTCLISAVKKMLQTLLAALSPQLWTSSSLLHAPIEPFKAAEVRRWRTWPWPVTPGFGVTPGWNLEGQVVASNCSESYGLHRTISQR